MTSVKGGAMHEQRLAFVEEFGVTFERMGSTRMLGRVWGALMVSDPPEVTADELAAFLQASRGSISQATRQLIEIGVVQRINKTGVRRDYYRVRRDAWREAFRREQDTIAGMYQLFRRGLDAMEGSSDEARRPLEEAIRFTQFWEEEMRSIFTRWDTYMENTNG
jgi:DNA-binding transcriptional regulator GbsR (MarR family)